MKLKRELGAIDVSDVLVDGPRTKRRKRASSPASPSANEDVDMINDDQRGDVGAGRVSREAVKEMGLKIWHAVRNAKGKDDRVLSYDFMRLPSKRQYGDYYNLIRRPISLDEIKAQLDSNAYPSIDGVKQDFDTCFRNAKKYNMRESQIWKDAKALHKIVAAEHKMLTGAEDDVDVIGSDGGDAGSDGDEGKGKSLKGKLGKPPSLNRLLKARMQRLVEKTDDIGRLMTEDFMELPPKKIYPLYYKTIKKLMCFDMIFKKIKRKEYSTVAEFAADVELVFSNALTFNEDHSPIWEDATALKEYFKHLMSDLPAPHALPEYAPTTYRGPPQNGKLKLRVPAPSQVHANAGSPPAGNAPLTVKLPAPAAQHQTGRQVPQAAKQNPVSRSPNLAVRPPSQGQTSHLQSVPQASSYLHPATFPHVHPHQPQPQYQQHSQPASQAQSTTHSISPSPLPPTPTPPNIVFDHPLRSVTLKTMPLGRTLKLDSSEGVRMWVLRLGRGETALNICDVRFLDAEESDKDEDEDEDGDEDEDKDDETRSGVTNGQDKSEVIVKANGSHVTATVPNKKEGDGVWEVSELKAGMNVLEVGEKGGEIWKVVLQRIGTKS